MTVFWIVAVLLMAAALLFALPPLFLRRTGGDVERRAVNVSVYRHQLDELENDLLAGEISEEHYQKSRQEIERRLLEDAQGADRAAAGEHGAVRGITAGVVGLGVPVFAVVLYWQLGNPQGLDPEAVLMAQTPPHGDMSNAQAQIEMMVGGLAERLRNDPSDIEGWVMLGRSLNVLGRYDQAAEAFSKAAMFVGNDPNVLADYADALAMASNQSLRGKPMELLSQALSIDPNHQKALWLLGTGYFEQGDFGAAIQYWERLQSLLPAGSEDAQVMAANLQEARSYLERARQGEFGDLPQSESVPIADNGVAQSASASSSGAAASASASASVSGVISLSPELQDKVEPNDTLFVYARAVSGPPMPLAIIKTQVADLPLSFSLDESQAMMPTLSLANVAEVIVGARVSKSGDAIAQSGDFQGLSEPVAVGSRDLQISIDTVVP